MTGGRSRPKQPRTPNDRIRPGSPHSKQQTLPASKSQHQFDSRLNRRYPPCSILGMRPFRCRFTPQTPVTPAVGAPR
jgi:hypothetical protein